MTLLAKVHDSFELPYGCVIVVKVLAGRVRAKDPIQLRAPDGRVRDTYIAAIEQGKYSLLELDRDRVGICLPQEFTKQDVPPGTEIWSLKD